MCTSSRARSLFLVLALALLVAASVAAPAQADAPTKVRDHVTTVACKAVNGPTVTRFWVASSELAGTEAIAQVSQDGVTVSEGYGTSEWTATTFRASVVLEDTTGGGHLDALGQAFLSGTYAATGTPTRVLNRFKDGNVRVVEDHTTTALTVSDIVLTINGDPVENVACEGEAVDGYLFFTAPSSYVSRGSFLYVTDCATENMTDLYLSGSIDALYVEFWYADTADSSAWSEVMDLTMGTFTGAFNYHDGTGPAGTVPATVSAVRSGPVTRTFVDRTDVYTERWVLTPYELHITADGREGAGASATCQLYDIDATQHLKVGKLDG